MSGNKLRILVADDEKIIADTLKLILAQAGYDVTIVYDGIAAVETARELCPDLFLSDVYMPRLSGIDAAIEICSTLPHCKVLLFSGQANLRELRREMGTKCHRFEVCSKPIHPTELLSRLEELHLRPS
jgi:CheY-like chemotaxis protein